MPGENPLPVSVIPDDMQIVTLNFRAEGDITTGSVRHLFYADRETVVDHIYVNASDAGSTGKVKVAFDDDIAVVDSGSTFLVGDNSSGDAIATGHNALTIDGSGSDTDERNNIISAGKFLNIEFAHASGTQTIETVVLRIRTKRR
tara:strand:+ start:11169 stop:11603 length:435 start_codon:yes stop_codon:yes gene_type:complete